MWYDELIAYFESVLPCTHVDAILDPEGNRDDANRLIEYDKAVEKARRLARVRMGDGSTGIGCAVVNADGTNPRRGSSSTRRESIRAWLRKTLPSIIFFQELKLKNFAKAIPYEVDGLRVEARYIGEPGTPGTRNGIAYDADRFVLRLLPGQPGGENYLDANVSLDTLDDNARQFYADAFGAFADSDRPHATACDTIGRAFMRKLVRIDQDGDELLFDELLIAVSYHGPHKGGGKENEVNIKRLGGLLRFLRALGTRLNLPFLLAGDFNMDYESYSSKDVKHDFDEIFEGCAITSCRAGYPRRAAGASSPTAGDQRWHCPPGKGDPLLHFGRAIDHVVTWPAVPMDPPLRRCSAHELLSYPIFDKDEKLVKPNVTREFSEESGRRIVEKAEDANNHERIRNAPGEVWDHDALSFTMSVGPRGPVGHT
jgi:hypothetical protein